MTSLQYYCILGLDEIKTASQRQNYAQKMQDAQVSKSLFPFLDGDVPRSPFYGVYISQLIHFLRECSNVDNFNNRNQFLTSKLLKQGY